MKSRLIYNPQAGRRRLGGKPVSRIVRWMEECGAEVECRPTRGPGDGRRLAEEAVNAGCQLVAAYGGDGTINEVVAGLAGSPVALGILPGGTSNALARELGIPRNLRRAVQVACCGSTVALSLGRAGGRYFHLMAGIGLDAAVVSAMPWSLKRALGVPAFWIQGFRQLFSYPLKPFVLNVDGVRCQGTFAVIANGRNYGGRLVLAPEADPWRDSLDVCLFESTSKARYLVYLAAAYLRMHLRLSDVRYIRGRLISVDGDPSIPVQVDGELAGRLPMDFGIVPSALQVKVPVA